MTESEIARLRRQVSTLEAENARLRAGAVEASGARDQHYRAIFESAVDFAVIAMDRDGRVTDWNTGAERILGWSAEEMQGEPADRIFTPEDRSEGRPGIEMRCASETGRAGDDCWHLRRDGSRFWARGEMMPLRGEDGVQLGYIKILRDRTEQERAVEALRRSEETLRLALDAGQAVGAWNWDIVNDRVYADARFAQLYSVDPARAVSGAPIAEFMAGMHPEDRDRVGLGVQRAVEEAGEFAEEYRLVQGDGSVRWVLARGRAYRDEAGNPTRFPGITVDITGRKGVEEALRASEERLRIAQRAGGVGTFEWYPDTGKLDVSDEYRRIWGLVPGTEVTADLLVSLLHPDDRGLSGPARLRLGENPLEYAEYRIIRPDTGEERWIARRGEVLLGDAPGARRFLGIAFDITERKLAEAALRENDARLRELLATLNLGTVMARGLDGTIRFWSDGCARLYGWTADEAVGRNAHALLGTVFPVPLAEVEAALERDGEWTGDLRHRARDGRELVVTARKVLRRDAEGQALAVLESLTDVTAQRSAEAEREAILGSIADGFIALDAEWRFTYVNAAAERLMGVSKEDLLGRDHWALYPANLGTVAEREFRRAMHERVPVSFENYYAPWGRWFDVRAYPAPDGGITAFFQDISERKRTDAALAGSEAHFRATFEQAAVGVAHVGVDGRWLRVNARLCTMLGFTEAELLARTFQETTHPDDLAANLVQIGQLVSGEVASVSFEKRYIRSDGGIVWAALATVLRRDPVSGAPLHFISVFQDITDRKRAEDALRESEEQLRLATDAAEIGLWDVDLVTDTLFWPSRVKAMFGISPDVQVSMADFYAGLHADDRERVSAAFAAAQDPARRALYDVEYRTIGKEDHALRWVAARGRGVFGADGTCLRVIGTALDITPRKRAESALRESEARYRILTEVSPQTVWMASTDGSVTYCNQWWFEFSGLTMEETKGLGWTRVIHPDHRSRLRHAWLHAATTGGAWNVEIPFRRASDGQYRWHLARGLPIYDGPYPEQSAGRITGWMGVAIDIHEQKLAREAMRELNEVLERRVAEEVAERAKAEEQLRQSQKMEAVGQLTGGLAHDFNNLLTGITGSLELMQARLSQGRTNDLDRYILAAQGAARRAAALTHRLLAFSRRQTLDPKPTKVDGLIAGMEELIRRTVGPAIEVEVVGAAGLWPALVDPNQLESALLNLCINARDAMPDGGRLTIETANRWLDERAARERELAPGQYLSLCVTDTGTGMTPEVIQRAFDPFFTTKPIGLGTGLGLSMVYGFARQSGGQVRIYTELGEGTTMCLYLPRYLGEEGDAASVELAGAPRAEQGETVLVVDDEPTVRMLVTEVLETLGYTAIEVADGPAGLKVLQSDVRIDLLITDVGLPGGMNGRQVADGGRAVRPSLKVLFITGYAENAVVGNGHLEPGMQVLTKPFTIEALANRIKDLIAGA